MLHHQKFMPMLALALVFSLGGLAAASALAADPPAPLKGEAAAIKKAVEAKLPGVQVRGVEKSSYFGLFEVQLDDRIVYTDAKARYLVIGSIFDADAKINLTDERMKKLNRVDVAALPLDQAIKKVKGTGERKLYVFSDVDCPFCAKLEDELKGVDNVTIYTFLFPIDQLHPDAARKSRKIWCAPDRAKAWDEFYASGTVPDNPGDCENPVLGTQAMGSKFRVTATPTLIFSDGSVVPGALPADRLEVEFKNAEGAAKKISAAKKS